MDYAKHCNQNVEKKMGKALLGAAQVAKQLGISRRTFESLVKEGNAPGFVWIGHQRRWRPEDVEGFIDRKLAENESLES